MSRSVYGGFKFKNNISLEEAVLWIQGDIKQFAQERDFNKFKLDIIDRAINFYDKKKMCYLGWVEEKSLPGNSSNAITDSFNQLKEERKDSTIDRIKMGNHSDPDEMNAYLFIHKTGIYGIFRCNFNEGDLFKKYGHIIKECDYWDGSDKPDEINDDEWMERERVWDDIFSKYSNLNEAGIKIMLSNQMSLSSNYLRLWSEIRGMEEKDKNKIINESKKRKSIENRVLNSANYINNAPWNENINGSSFSVSKFIKHLNEIQDGKNEMFNEARKILEPLFRPLTMNDLIENYINHENKWEKEKLSLYEKDIPSSLLTPCFEKKMLSSKILPLNKKKNIKKM